MTQLASPPSAATAPAAGPSPAPRLQAPRRAAWLAAGAVLALALAALLSVGLGTLRLDALEAVRAVVAQPPTAVR